MLSVVKLSWALFIGMALIMLGNGLQTSLLGLRASIEGFPTVATGLIMSAFYVGFLAGSRMTPRIVRKVGHIRVFAAWSSMASASILMHGLFVDPWFWVAMRFVTGFCFAGLYVVAESWLNERADNRSRGRLLSIYMVVQYLGLAGGQLLLNLSSPTELVLFILTSVLISLALVPISLTTSTIPPTGTQEHLGLRALSRLTPLGLAACAGAGLSTGVLLGMGPVFAANIGLSVGQVSVFMALLILGAATLQFPLGRFSDELDRRRVIITINIVAAIVMLCAWATTGMGIASTLVLVFIVGGVSMPLYALGVATTNDDLRPAQMVAASSSLVLVFGIGASLGPVGISVVMSLTGPHSFFVGLAVIHGSIALFAIYRTTKREPLESAEQGEYQATAGSTTLRLHDGERTQ